MNEPSTVGSSSIVKEKDNMLTKLAVHSKKNEMSLFSVFQVFFKIHFSSIIRGLSNIKLKPV